MTRIKRGVQVRKTHKNILAKTKGYKLGRKNLIKQAKQAVFKAGQHAYRDRRNKKRDFKTSWIMQLNAAARLQGMPYKDFMYGLKIANIGINRKVLSELSIQEPEEFKKIAEKAKAALVK